jgi:hypothetical protein
MIYDNSLAILQLASTRVNWKLATLQFVNGIWNSKKLPLIFLAPLLLFAHEENVQFRNFYFC